MKMRRLPRAKQQNVIENVIIKYNITVAHMQILYNIICNIISVRTNFITNNNTHILEIQIIIIHKLFFNTLLWDSRLQYLNKKYVLKIIRIKINEYVTSPPSSISYITLFMCL